MDDVEFEDVDDDGDSLVEDGEVDGWNPEVGGRCRSGEVRGLGEVGEVVDVVMAAGELDDAFREHELMVGMTDCVDLRVESPAEVGYPTLNLLAIPVLPPIEVRRRRRRRRRSETRQRARVYCPIVNKDSFTLQQPEIGKDE
jgi:hypothetical protein